MGGITLKEKKKQEQEREAKILRALEGRKKALAEAKRDGRRKKKSVDELLPLLAMHGMAPFVLRPADTYVPKSHNLDKQITGLINHLFVQYPVPDFLYQVCLAEPVTEVKSTVRRRAAVKDKKAIAQATYRRWFVTLAQGGSFKKLVKGVMTSREAVAFLAAPAGRTVPENVWWAKMTVAGVPEALIGRLIERVFTGHLLEDPDGRLAEAILFYARHHQGLTRNSFDEVTDFLAHKLRHDPQFRMKGRTASSVVKLSDEWHLEMQRAKLGAHIAWAGTGYADWVYEDKDTAWFVTELRDNHALLNEGRRQKHCVYSYVPYCVTGHSFIFSLRACFKMAVERDAAGKPLWDKAFETRRVTVEVRRSQALVQAKGPLNRPPTAEEQGVLRRWAGEKGVTVPKGVLEAWRTCRE